MQRLAAQLSPLSQMTPLAPRGRGVGLDTEEGLFTASQQVTNEPMRHVAAGRTDLGEERDSMGGHMNKYRVSITAFFAAVGSLVVAGPAAATPPGAVTYSLAFPGTSTAGDDGYCPFPVTIDVVDNQRLTETTLPDGTVIDRYRGAAFATAINDNTGKSARYTISGPATFTTAPDGTVTIDAKGGNLLWATVAQAPPNGPPILYATGHVRATVAPSGRVTDYSLDGHATDVCAVLS